MTNIWSSYFRWSLYFNSYSFRKKYTPLFVQCFNYWQLHTAWKVFKYGVFSGPQGYDQKRKLFRTNRFVLAQSSAKKFYIEQITVKPSIQWYHMTLIWRHLVLAVITAWHKLVSVPAFAYYRIFCLACYRLCVEQWPAFPWAIRDIV